MLIGLNAFHADASAALLREGEINVAVEEERFNRIKHWAGLPLLSAKACLSGEQPEHIAISRDPRANLGSKILRVVSRPLDWKRLASRASNSVHVARAFEQLSRAGVRTERNNFHLSSTIELIWPVLSFVLHLRKLPSSQLTVSEISIV
jgi:predicted NodU family carbamoyl transferase